MKNTDFINEVTVENFTALVLEKSKEIPIVVDFWAAWCGPCQILMPILTKLAEEYQGKFMLAKIDTEPQQELANQWNIRSLPTVKLFRNGKVVDEFVGVLSENQIKSLIDKYIERDSDRAIDSAIALAQKGNPLEAIALLKQTLKDAPTNKRTPLELSKLYIAQRDYDHAEQLLKTIPKVDQNERSVKLLFTIIEFGLVALNSPSKTALKEILSVDSNNHEARYQLSSIYIIEEDYEDAIILLLEVLRRNKNYNENIAQKSLLKIFEILGGDGPLVTRYRSEMFKMLH